MPKEAIAEMFQGKLRDVMHALRLVKANGHTVYQGSIGECGSGSLGFDA